MNVEYGQSRGDRHKTMVGDAHPTWLGILFHEAGRFAANGGRKFLFCLSRDQAVLFISEI